MTTERLDGVFQDVVAMGALVLVEKGTVLDGTTSNFVPRHCRRTRGAKWILRFKISDFLDLVLKTAL